MFVQDEFDGFTDDDIRRVSKRTSAVEVLRESLRKRSQPAKNVCPSNTQHVRRQRVVDAKTVPSRNSSDKVTITSVSSSASDSSPTRGSLKGNIKVRLLLGRYKLLPTAKERRPSKTSLGKVVKNSMTVSRTAGVVKERRKRQKLSSGHSDDSAVSSSEESDVKYSLSVDTVTIVPKRGRPSLQSAVLKHARARQLVSKAREGLQADKKSNAGIVTRPWAPYWHGRLQLPTQSSRSCRKITINRWLLDDSYTSIGQLGLSRQVSTEESAVQLAQHDRHSDTKHVTADSGRSRVRGVGVLNRPLVSRHGAKQWKRLQARDKTALARPRVRRSKLSSDTTAVAAAEDETVTSADADKIEPPWLTNAHRSIYSFQSKRGSMAGKHCYICDNAYLVHHHFMCRVPCCRACARFYRMHCIRGTRLDQLTCTDQGE